MKQHDGYSLIELLITLAIIGLTVSIAVPQWHALRRRAAVRMAASEIKAIFRAARSRAITRGANTGVKFTKGAVDWQYTIYDDGDGDGIHTDDIAKGIDRRVTGPRYVTHGVDLASISIPSTVKADPDGDAMTSSSSPVQFGSSSICSFSPIGESTPGTIYLADAAGLAYAVRVTAGSARVRVLRYEPKTQKWDIE